MRFAIHAPVFGVAVAVCLFVAAALQYPGYRWDETFMSALFAARPSRSFAVPGLLFLCVSLAHVFARIAATARSTGHRKVIQIGGIGAMVYAFLTATPMHDLMITVALPFALAALFATIHLLYVERRRLLFAWGALVVVLLVINAAMYYAKLLGGVLPAMQKANWLISVSWLFAVYYTRGYSSLRQNTVIATKSAISAIHSTGSSE